jgi:Cu/Ag efflux protein CusF
MKNVYLLLGLILSVSFGINADYTITEDQYNDIKYKVSTLDETGLKTREASLITEINQLNEEQDNTQSPSKKKQNNARLALLLAELSEVQSFIGYLQLLYSLIMLSSDSSFIDITPPSIGIIGDNPVTIELGTAYVDAGAYAIDAVDASVQVTSSGSVNTNVVGSYTITYTATDRSGNSASATRTVNVVDTTAPAVTVTGDNPATVELGATYTDAGATATDASGTVTVVTTGTVDTDTVGTYTLTYTSTDASDNAGTATRTVNVVDTTAPVVTVTGDNPATVELRCYLYRCWSNSY